MPSTAYLASVKSYQFMSINAPQHQPANPLPQHIAPVSLDKAYRLLNHGPTVLVSAAHAGQHNVMAAAWACALDFVPPKARWCWTRPRVRASWWRPAACLRCNCPPCPRPP